jgi:hypothetical protein
MVASQKDVGGKRPASSSGGYRKRFLLYREQASRRRLQLPLERPVQHRRQQRIELGGSLCLQRLQRVDLRLERVE